MTDRFISREWLESLLNSYKRLHCWNTNILDGDTVLRVLEVLENEIKHAPDIGTRKLGGLTAFVGVGAALCVAGACWLAAPWWTAVAPLVLMMAVMRKAGWV